MKRILIVEDDAVVAGIYQNKLQSEGFEVEVAGDGPEAIRAVKTRPPSLVLLDLGIPKINGLGVLGSIRSNPESASLPVIVLSNAYASSMVQAAWKGGANKCVSKGSCTPRQIVEMVLDLLPKEPDPPAPAAPASAPSEDPDDQPFAAQSADVLAPPVQSDLQFQEQVRRNFVQSLPAFAGDLRARSQALARMSGAEALDELFEFYRVVHSLTGNAGLAGFGPIARLSTALEALLKELCEKPKNIGPSSVRTVAGAVDALARLFGSATADPNEELRPFSALVVDDDDISRQTICLALQKANLCTVSVDDPAFALRLLKENSFSLIFSDIDMPGLGGFDFCKQLRVLPGHQATPVIFVTALSDFESRAHSKLSGGTDFIGKPFLLLELAVKALTHLSLSSKPRSAS